jgi:hypothetical protein
MAVGNFAAGKVRLLVWCRECSHQVEPDPGEMSVRYSAEMSVPDWHVCLVCSGCGGRQVDMVVSGTKRR